MPNSYTESDPWTDQDPDYEPGPGPQTTQNAQGKWVTTYVLSQPMTPQEIAEIRANVARIGTGGGVQVTPDGLRMTITAATQSSMGLLPMLAIVAAVLATAGAVGSLIGGSGAAAAAAAGGSTLGAGTAGAGAGTLASTTIGSGFIPGIAGGTGIGAGAGAGAAGGAGLLAARQTVPFMGTTTAGAVPTGMAGAGAGAGLLPSRQTVPNMTDTIRGGVPRGMGETVGFGLDSIPDWLKAALRIGVPLAGGKIASRGAGGPGEGLDPEMQANFAELMKMATARQRRVDPLHQAAVAMATRMAPSYARGGAPSGPAPAIPRNAMDELFGRR